MPIIGLDRDHLVRIGYGWGLAPTLLQFIVGPVVLFTLPSEGLANHVIVTILIGALIALPATLLMLVEVRSPPAIIGRRFWPVVTLLTSTVVFMGSGRHLYREASLAQRKELMRAKTQQYLLQVERARREQVK